MYHSNNCSYSLVFINKYSSFSTLHMPVHTSIQQNHFDAIFQFTRVISFVFSRLFPLLNQAANDENNIYRKYSFFVRFFFLHTSRMYVSFCFSPVFIDSSIKRETCTRVALIIYTYDIVSKLTGAILKLSILM